MVNCQSIKSNKGFSLAEIMVAILILGTTFIGLIQAFPYAMSIIKTAENESLASYLAQEKIEELNQLGYDNIGIGVIEEKHRLGADSYLYYFQRQTNVIYIDSDFQYSATDTGLKMATTTVYFTNAVTKNEKEYTLTTVLTDR